MEEFKAALINEVEKLYKRKKVLVALIYITCFHYNRTVIYVGIKKWFWATWGF